MANLQTADVAIYYKNLLSIYKNGPPRHTPFTQSDFNSPIDSSIDLISEELSVSHAGLHRLLAAAVISAALATSFAPAVWAAASDEQVKQEWARHRQEMLKARLFRVNTHAAAL